MRRYEHVAVTTYCRLLTAGYFLRTTDIYAYILRCGGTSASRSSRLTRTVRSRRTEHALTHSLTNIAPLH